mgnify:CR=1 FL=1|tara:strand:- start:1951 stop:2931 length:981 start_codon:yes stop_codon:yes gene_type:complete
MPKKKVPKLPKLLNTKIYKTGQTRGADDDVIFQNRVSRKSTVLIPFALWDEVSAAPEGEESFESGFICLLTPKEFFETDNIQQILADKGLSLGTNALVFYQIRTDWESFNPEEQGWSPANSRTSPLLGQYVARIAATTADNGEKISRGFNTTGMKGAGIRLFEYATTKSINECRIQLEAIFWLCHDSLESVTEFSMTQDEAVERRNYCLDEAQKSGLLDYELLKEARMVNEQHQTICPLCLEPLSSYGFFNRLVQATGREVHDLTVTEINLFHIKELRYGEYNHRAYNLGWGHHHCNVVVKDSGIDETLSWMEGVVARNKDSGYMR